MDRLVRECEIFGLRILSTGSGVFQSISHARTTSLAIRDFSSEARPGETADEWQASLFETAFDIADAELFRACLIKIADDQYRYVGLAHHIMMDGWGFSNWAKLLCQLYNDPSGKIDSGIPWREIASEDEKYIASERYIKDRAYWAEHVKTIAPPSLNPRRRRSYYRLAFFRRTR